jgi:hypothetical protein
MAPRIRVVHMRRETSLVRAPESAAFVEVIKVMTFEVIKVMTFKVVNVIAKRSAGR